MESEKTKSEKTEHKKKYVMLFECSNCFCEFKQSIPFGRKAIDNAGRCPYCGVSYSGTSNIWHKPLSFIDV